MKEDILKQIWLNFKIELVDKFIISFFEKASSQGGKKIRNEQGDTINAHDKKVLYRTRLNEFATQQSRWFFW